MTRDNGLTHSEIEAIAEAVVNRLYSDIEAGEGPFAQILASVSPIRIVGSSHLERADKQ
ncbi:MAG: hypothetical protein Hals2KO_21340 [Halioglobus sp.]